MAPSNNDAINDIEVLEENDNNYNQNGDEKNEINEKRRTVKWFGNGQNNRHVFQTKLAVTLSLATLALVALLSLAFSSSPYEDSDFDYHRFLDDNNNEEDNDYSTKSCGDLFHYVPHDRNEQCKYAKTCNAGDGIFASFVFCNHSLSVMGWFGVLSPILIIWLVTLFRMLGTTAEDFFSPSLEMFSLKMGLPPRFAGVTLLALGNGAADVSATINAIKSDPKTGYQMSLGALTGAGMFVGTVVSGVVIVLADGVACRGALVRDVVMFIITIAIVFWQLKSGVIGAAAITLFFTMYAAFVAIVLIADVYHRAVVVPRMERLREERERERQRLEGEEAQQAAEAAVDKMVNEVDANELANAAEMAASGASPLESSQQSSSQNIGSTEMSLAATAGTQAFIRITSDNAPGTEQRVPVARNGALSNVLMALSNYDKYETQGIEDPLNGMSGWGMDGNENEKERPIVLHGTHGILNKLSILKDKDKSTKGSMYIL